MKTNDIFEYDTLKIYAKKQSSKEVIKNYSLFGWKLKENTDNDKYEDICDLEFFRPHKIANKDELQLQQVYMEENLNNQAKLERNKNSVVVSLGLSLNVFAILTLCFGIIMFTTSSSILNIIFGTLLCICTIALIVLDFTVLPKIYKKQKAKYLNKKTKLEEELKQALEKATMIRGGENGK